jgi:plasmid stabilization system protein ParE
MSRKVRWATRARLELARAVDYCGERDPDWAFAVRNAIFDKIEFLREFPFLSTPIARVRHRVPGSIGWKLSDLLFRQ